MESSTANSKSVVVVGKATAAEKYVDEEKDRKALALLRQRMTESGNPLFLKNSWEFPDDMLLRYIRSRHYDIDSAFDRFSNHMRVRRHRHPEVFARLYPSAVRHAMETRTAYVLKERDGHGRQVMVIRAAPFDPDVIAVEDFLLLVLLLGWEMLGSAQTQLAGIVVLIDAAGFNFRQARHATPGNVQKYIDLILRSSPFKCKGAHIVHAHALFNMCLNMVKVFLPHKIRKRIHLHGHAHSSLHAHIPASSLPSDYGGELPSHEAAMDTEIHRRLTADDDVELYYRQFCK